TCALPIYRGGPLSAEYWPESVPCDHPPCAPPPDGYDRCKSAGNQGRKWPDPPQYADSLNALRTGLKAASYFALRRREAIRPAGWPGPDPAVRAVPPKPW